MGNRYTVKYVAQGIYFVTDSLEKAMPVMCPNWNQAATMCASFNKEALPRPVKGEL